MILIIVLVVLILICFVKYSSNKDTMKTNCKTDADKENVKNARKVYSKTITTTVLLLISILSLVILLLLNFTDIEYTLKDFISTDIIEKEANTFNYLYYLIPIYILVCRQIIIEVNLGDFLYKFFKVEEPQLEENVIKNLLYKKEKPKEKISLQEYIEQLEQTETKENVEATKEIPTQDIELPIKK